MGRSQLALSIALALAGIALPEAAHAQSAEDKAAADAAFDQGKRLMAARSYAEACQKFAESLRRDPGVGTMLGLADCYEKSGRTASAWAQFREAAAAAGRRGDAREKVARENADRLTAHLARLVIHVPRDSGTLAVRRDGVDVGRALWGVDVPLDPGVHTLTASAPGKKSWQALVTISAGPGVQSIMVPELEPEPVAPSRSPVFAKVVSTMPPSPSPEHDQDPGRTQRVVAWSIAGVGLAGLAVGAIFGGIAKSKLDESNSAGHCGPADDCDPTGLSLRKDANSAAFISTLGVVLGAAAVAGGAVLYFTSPRASPSSSHVAVAIAPMLRGGGAGGAGAYATLIANAW